MSDSRGPSETRRKGSSALITDARTPTSVEHDSRVRRYAWTMGFRTACFVAMIFVEGPMRWVLFAGAVLLPYVAVILANQANQRSQPSRQFGAEPQDLPQLTTGPEESEVISGAVIDGDEPTPRQQDRDRKVA